MNRDNFDDFDDELDDNFETNETQNMSEQQIDNLVNSFSKPEDLDNPDDPIDEKEMKNLLANIKNMPKAKLQQYLKQLTGKNNFNLGNNNFSAVSDVRRLGARDKLRKKLEAKRKNKETDSAKQYKVSIPENQVQDVDDIMKDIDSIDKKKKKKKKKKKN